MPMQKFEWRHSDQWASEADWVEVEVYSARDAAVCGAEEWDQEEHGMIRDGQCRTFEVRDAAGTVTRWNVYGEAVPQYSAVRLVS